MSNRLFRCSLLTIALGFIAVPATAQITIKNEAVAFKFGFEGQLWADWTQDFMDADHGLTESPEVIFCRNVIIYFDQPTQVRLLGALVRQLAPGRYFFADRSESLQNMDLPLAAVGTAVYRKCA